MKKWGISPGSPEFRDDLPPPEVTGSCIVRPLASSDLKVATRTTITDFRPLFGIYTGQGWERWSPKSIDEGGIGGSETATICTAREFAKRGYRSVVFGDCDGMEGVYDGVEYIHYTKWDEFRKANRFHFFVSSRRADIFEHPIMADKKAIIVHDIWLSQDPNANLWTQNVDKFFVLSPWHKEFFLKHHKNADPSKTVVSRDGIDLGRFERRLPKEPGRMVYSSSPDRGLDVLLDCLPEIRKRVPHANVHVFYGFQNWEKAIKHRGGRPGELEWMNSIKARLDDPGVVYRERVGQTQLAKEMLKAELFAFPTQFTETFCITGAEQMAAGNPVITSDLAALSTTIGDAGILIGGVNHTPEYKARFIDEVVSMLSDKAKWWYYSEKSIKKAKAYSWEGIVDEWLGLVGLPVPGK
jgi:glycosyltransferase involved in cell wall biosynthesis